MFATFTVGDVTVTDFSGLSNSPGSAASPLFDSTLEIINATATTATVVLWTTAQNFTGPTGSLSWSNEESIDGILGTTQATAIDCVDSLNQLAPPGTTDFCLPPGQMNPNITETINGASSANNTATSGGVGRHESVLPLGPNHPDYEPRGPQCTSKIARFSRRPSQC